MTKEELKAKIAEYEKDAFLLAMKDHWSSDDFVRDRQIFDKIQELKKQLKEME